MDLIAATPATLDTLKEISKALNNDGDFAGTVVSRLSEKAPIADPSFTGTAKFVSVSGITKGMVGLGKVDNTTDAEKVISVNTQTALDAKEAVIVTASPLAKSYRVGGPNNGKMLLSMDTAAVYTIGSLKAPGNAEIDGLHTVDNASAGALSCSRGLNAISGPNSVSVNNINTVVAGPVVFSAAVAASSLDVAGDVTGGGFAAFFDSYSVTALNKKET